MDDEESVTARTLRLMKAEWIADERKRLTETVGDMLPGAKRQHHNYFDYLAGWQDAIEAVLDVVRSETED